MFRFVMNRTERGRKKERERERKRKEERRLLHVKI